MNFVKDLSQMLIAWGYVGTQQVLQYGGQVSPFSRLQGLQRAVVRLWLLLGLVAVCGSLR